MDVINLFHELREKFPKFGVIAETYLSAFGLNTDRQFECGKILTRNFPVFEHFLRSDFTGLFLCSLKLVRHKERGQ